MSIAAGVMISYFASIMAGGGGGRLTEALIRNHTTVFETSIDYGKCW